VKREFDTHLTPVFHGVNRHPFIYERAANPDYDRSLLASETLFKQHLQNSHKMQSIIASHKQHKSAPKLKETQSMPQFKSHKAYWVVKPGANESNEMSQVDNMPLQSSKRSGEDKPKMELVQ
jgi:hypothetical protein